MSSEKISATRGYPLAALFLVLTASGIVAALVGPAVRAVAQGGAGTADMLLASVFCGLAVMALGGAMGVLHFHRLWGLCWGIVAGGAIGLFTAPLIVAPRESLGTILGISLGGTVVVVVLTLTFQLASRRP